MAALLHLFLPLLELFGDRYHWQMCLKAALQYSLPLIE